MTTDPAAVIADQLVPTCPECGATYGPAGRDFDARVFGPWLERHTNHDPEVPRGATR
jgi:hypothetical protein